MTERTVRPMPSPTPSTLLADLTAMTPSKANRSVCRAGHALNQLPPEDRAAVYDILDNRPDVTVTDVAGVLERHGVTVRAESLRRHRRRSQQGGCACPRVPA